MASLVEILIKAKDQVSAVIDGITGSLDGLGKGAEDAEQVSSDAFGDIFDSAMDAFVGINQGVELAIKAFDLLKGAYDGTVGKVLEIAGEVREFVRISGDAPENMSALRLEAEKADVPFDDLYKAMENLNKNGVAPTLENLTLIAQEYVNLQDPIAQAQFLTENFGSAGDEIAPMLEAIAGGITTVQDAGLIFTNDDIQSVKDYEQAVAELKLTWEGLSISIGKKIIPEITASLGLLEENTIDTFPYAAESVGLFKNALGLLNDEFRDNYNAEYYDGVAKLFDIFFTAPDIVVGLTEFIEDYNNELSDNSNIANSAAQANGYLVRSILANSTSWRGFQQDMEAAGLSMRGWTEASYNAEKGISAAGEAAAGASGGMQAMADATNNANEAMKAYSEALLFKIASEGLSESGALALAGAMGLVDQKTVAATEQVNFYQSLLDSGAINQRQYNLLVGQLADDIANLPDGKNLEVTTNAEDVQADLDELENRKFKPKPLSVNLELDTSEVDNYQPGNKSATVTYHVNYIDRMDRAAGGVVNAAAGVAAGLSHYWVGERGPEPFFPSVDGRIVSNTQAMSALRGGAGVNSREIANAVRDGVKDAMRETKAGNVYNLTMPTSNNPADVRTAFELMEAWA